MNKRVETGPYRFDGDWPGYFIRGDEALALAKKLRFAADAAGKRNDAHDFLIALASRLEECRAVPQQGAA